MSKTTSTLSWVVHLKESFSPSPKMLIYILEHLCLTYVIIKQHPCLNTIFAWKDKILLNTKDNYFSLHVWSRVNVWPSVVLSYRNSRFFHCWNWSLINIPWQWASIDVETKFIALNI
jgi:hypothetical protein